MELIDELRECLTDRYDIERELGGGGMSRVFVATERTLSRRVVIKVLSPELGQAVNADRFRLEIATSAKLQHPQIIPVYATGSCGNLLYYVMPFVAGESLRAELERSGRLHAAEVTRILTLIARGLAYAHREGVVHRDIKPENILLAQGEPLLADFGIAKVIREGNNTTGLTSSGMSIGTVTYMAPEQVVADPSIDGRADVYSLAALGFELLTGTPPFIGSPQQVMSAHVVTPAPSVTERVSGVPASLAAAISRGLVKEAADRPDADAFVALLAATSDTVPATLPPASARRRMLMPSIAAAVAVAAISVLVVRTRTSDSTRRSDSASVPEAAATVTVAEPGLAVLPFENIGNAGQDAYFAAGLTAELTTAIGKVPGVRIASRSTVRALADSGLTSTELGRRLGVSALVEGSAQRAGERLRVTARLIDVTDGRALWSETYDGTVADVFTTQSEISAAIVAALAPRFGTVRTASQSGAGTTNLDAYDLFLRARFAQDARDLKAAIELYREAIAKDPRFARAHSGIAEASALLPLYGSVTHAALAGDIRAAAMAALQLDSTLADPHTALGLLAKGTADWSGAERELRRATELQPSSGVARQTFGELLLTLGNFKESNAALGRAVQLEPMNGLIVGQFAYVLMLDGMLDSAGRTIDRALQLESRNPFLLYTKGVIAERAGDFRAAVGPVQAAVARTPQPFFLGVLARVQRLAGDSVSAARTRQQLIAMGTAPGAHLARAVAEVGLGAPADVIDELKRAVAQRDPLMYALPMRLWWFDPLRDDPLFAEVIGRLGLPAVARSKMP